MTSEPDAESKPTGRRKVKKANHVAPRGELSEIVAEEVASLATGRDFDAEAEFQANEHKRKLKSEAAEHTRLMERTEAAHRRWKESAILISGLVLAVAVCVSCLAVIVSPKSSDELRKAALAGLFSLVTAALGFIAGKGSGKTA